MGQQSGQIFYEKQRFSTAPHRSCSGDSAVHHARPSHLASRAGASLGKTADVQRERDRLDGIPLGRSIFRLITVRLVTEVRDGELVVSLRGFWRSRRILLSEIRSAEMISFDPVRDYGGYGIRTGRFGKAYIALGQRGVRIKLANGATVVVGSQRSEEMAGLCAPL